MHAAVQFSRQTQVPVKEIASNILRLEIQDGSRRFFLNGMHCVLFNLSYALRYFLFVYFYKK